MGKDEDEIPLTRDHPSITQETKARFEALLNAALTKTDMSRNTIRPPLPKPRTKKLKRKKLRHISNVSGNITPSEDESQSIRSVASEENSQTSVKKLRRNQIIFAAEIHSNSSNNSNVTSSRQCLIDDNEHVRPYISATSEDDVLTVKTKTKPPKIIPRQTITSANNTVKGQNEKIGSETDVSILDNTDNVKELTKSSNDNNSVASHDETNNNNKTVLLHSISDETEEHDSKEDNNNRKNSATSIKTPVPLPRRSKSKSSSPASTINSPKSVHSDKSINIINENVKLEKKIVPANIEVINEVTSNKMDDSTKSFGEKSHSTSEKVNIFSSSNEIDNDEEDTATTKKRTKKKKKLRKRSSHDNDEIEMAEMGRSGSATTTSVSMDTLRRKADVSEQTFSRKHSVPDDNAMFGITVHGTDMLQPHALLRHPMVRVYIVDVTTGQFLNKSDPTRPASFCDEQVDYILPIMTHQYDFKQHRCLIPGWEEVLIFNENMSHIVKPDTVIFFEIVDFVNLTMGSLRYDRLGPDSGWYHVAWAFIKLVAANGELNTDKKLRLQLYKPKNKYNTPRKATVPVVYNWWKEGLTTCIKYPSTLYITVGRVTPPSVPLTPNLRSRVVLQNEQGSVASIASTSVVQTDDDNYEKNDEFNDDDSQGKSSAKRHRPVEVTWSRLPAQSCKLTNDKLVTLPVTPSGGFSIKFSNNGLHLACGTASCILVFSVPRFKKPLILSGHQGLIYSIRWSVDDAYIISSSADCTACVWDLRKKIPSPHVLAHPSFVYCADFVPHFIRRTVITGCCDSTIRVWIRNKPAPYHLAQELNGHTGFINALCFSSDGISFYTGDSIGDIKMWQFDHESGEWSCSRDIKIREIRGTVINNIILHSGGNRMLIHTRDSMLRMIDIPTYAVIQWFHGCCNERIQMSSCLTPCGGMVLSCSEDGLLCVWDSNTGAQLGLYNSLIKQSSSSAVTYHPLEHMMAVVCYHPDTASQSQPLHICNYDRISSGKSVGLKVFETNEKQPNKYLKENDKLFGTDKQVMNEDVWQKIETSSMKHTLLYSNVLQNMYTSTPHNGHQSVEKYNNISPYSVTSNDRNISVKNGNGVINDTTKKRKKLLLDKKDNSWSKLSKAGGYLIEKSLTINRGFKEEINHGFEGDTNEYNLRVEGGTTILSSNTGSNSMYGRDYNDRLTDIIHRMDKVLLNVSSRNMTEPKL